MKTGIKAFSLTELMIVIVIIAIIFSAMAPIITKRHISDSYDNESIWNLIAGDPEYNSFFDPGNPAWTSSVYVGITPTSADNNAGKLVINSSDISYNSKTYKQPQMQFRFSNDVMQQSRGISAATLYVGPSSNIVFGSAMPTTDTSYSTIYGLNNLNVQVTKTGAPLSNAKYLTAMGHSALGNAKITETGKPQYIVAVGDSAANRIGTSEVSDSIYGIYIGSKAGSGLAETVTPPTKNIAIGYGAMSYKGSTSEVGGLGSHNVFVGADTGNKFSSAGASYNTVVGSNYVGAASAYNTIIGYGAYDKGDPDSVKITAIGYGACNSVKNTDGSRVCIGYNSGVSTNNTPTDFDTDAGEHIYIGGKPQSSSGAYTFPGRSVLEVHNAGGTNSYGNVVLNSNLVVRGNFFPSDGDNIAYNVFKTTRESLASVGAAERLYYSCFADSKRSILTYNNYVCDSLREAQPKSRNLLYKGGNCTTENGYTKGGNCPNIISSDIRLKENISENYDGLNKILEINPYNYTYKSEPNTPMVGVVAQDLQKIFPDAVSKDSNGFFKIRWEDMFFALVNAVKELSAKIDTIGEKLADLRQNISVVKNNQSDINADISQLNKRIKILEKKRGVNGNN